MAKNEIVKDKTFAASLAVVVVALLASQGVELENAEVQVVIEGALAAVAACAASVAVFRAFVIKVSNS